ncbi:MAG TPA: RNA polymerase sigma-54 factor, partial [Verrucomicrobiae bacterium]|nr:RNA polymerase sigma-54 factor [Verrucomicrobiae bacterium]
MRLGYSLNLEQTQKLIMTPELRQAITILQLPILELSQYVEEQLLENPLLEVKEEREEEGLEEQQPAQEQDMDWQEYFQDKTDLGIIKPKREEINEFTFENFLSEAPTLQEYLTQQLCLAVKSQEDRDIGEYLIGNIDDNGYLTVEPEDAATALGCSVEAVFRVLGIIRTFDPVGVGARNLQDCLILQLEQLSGVPCLAKNLIEEYLPDLAAGRITKIATALGVSPKEVQEIGDFLRTLDPKPGRKFSSGKDIR